METVDPPMTGSPRPHDPTAGGNLGVAMPAGREVVMGPSGYYSIPGGWLAAGPRVYTAHAARWERDVGSLLSGWIAGPPD